MIAFCFSHVENDPHRNAVISRVDSDLEIKHYTKES
jgi:hypothetical protein